ncbi:MAG: DNA mismatch repair protein MutL, partial [Odoribacteraceae bacterium]|nr:DNA mismatch repair protein MutL [Odoribacteraceae bacterium]
LIKEIKTDLALLGYELLEEENNSYALHATPPDFSYARGRAVLIDLIANYKNTENPIREKMKEHVALSMAKAASLSYNTPLNQQEMSELFDALFACQHPNYTAEGRTIIHILHHEEIGRWF